MHAVILKGRLLKDAAAAGGYPDPFTMSNALYRATGFRPSALRDIGWSVLVDAWIDRQRRRGALVARPADRSSESTTLPDSASVDLPLVSATTRSQMTAYGREG